MNLPSVALFHWNLIESYKLHHSKKNCRKLVFCVFTEQLLYQIIFQQLRCYEQKKPSIGILIRRCSENMQQICRKQRCRRVISIKLLCNFIEITLRHGCSPVNLLHIFRTALRKNTYGGLLRYGVTLVKKCNKPLQQKSGTKIFD